MSIPAATYVESRQDSPYYFETLPAGEGALQTKCVLADNFAAHSIHVHNPDGSTIQIWASNSMTPADEEWIQIGADREESFLEILAGPVRWLCVTRDADTNLVKVMIFRGAKLGS